LERITDAVSAAASSTGFIVVHLGWFVVWVGLNALFGRTFDPYPFSLLTLLVSLEAILLTGFVLISQDRMTKLADRRAHLDLQVNLLAEQELTAILRVVCLIAEKTGLELEGCDPNLDQLLGRTDVRALNDELTKEMATVDRATEAVSVDTTAATKDGRARIRISHASGWRHMSGPRPEVRLVRHPWRVFISAAVRPPCAEHRPESLP
jgi:uncharacterized membrane protein